MILVVDNKGQYVHRILRTLKYLDVESEIIPNTTSISEIKNKNPNGIILSGGPYSVYSDGDKLANCYKILGLDMPVLGICLGHQIIANHFNGRVQKGKSGEFAEVEILVKDEDDIFKNLGDKLTVWESHNDEVTEISSDLKCLASSSICEYESIRHKTRNIYGVQFHPEVYHTAKGPEMFKNFLDICNI